MFPNNWSALRNREFVEAAIQELKFLSGSIEEVFSEHELTVSSPLGVVPKKGGKFRLILDLR